MYNFKSDNKIKYTEFCCEYCLTQEIMNALQFIREYECIDLIAEADVIIEVLGTLLNIEIDGKAFTLGMVDIDGGGHSYCREYTLSISDDFSIWVEPTWRRYDGKYELLNSESYVTFMHDYSDGDILDKLAVDGNNVIAFGFEDEDEDEDE